MPGPAADPRLAAALRAGAGTASGRAELLAALLDATVFAGVTATSTGEAEALATGLTAESGAELAVLLLEAADGSRALPVFTDVHQLRTWRIDARPVPLTGAQACQAARDEGAHNVVLDPAGTAVVLDPSEVAALADGWVPVPGSSLATRTARPPLSVPRKRPSGRLIRSLKTSLAGEEVRAARLLEGPDGLVLGIAAETPLTPSELAALGHRILSRLGSAMPAAGLGLTQVSPWGPGTPVLRSRRRRGLLLRRG